MYSIPISTSSNKYTILHLTDRGGIVVEHSTGKPKIQGLNPDTGTREEKVANFYAKAVRCRMVYLLLLVDIGILYIKMSISYTVFSS
jgi:hypothetical protein